MWIRLICVTFVFCLIGCSSSQKRIYTFQDYVKALQIMHKDINGEDKPLSKNLTREQARKLYYKRFRKSPYAKLTHQKEKSFYELKIYKSRPRKIEMGEVTRIKVYKNFMGQARFQVYSYKAGLTTQRHLPEVEKRQLKKFHSCLERVCK